MSGIDGIGPREVGWTARRGGTRSGGGFSVSTPADAAPARPTESASAVTAAGMLALQEDEGGAVQDRAARRHGRAMLTALAELQRTLLANDDDVATLAKLAELVTHMPRATDPALAAAVDAVTLRARIELARRGR